MGLYVGFGPEDLGFPLSLEQTVLGDTVTVDIQYEDACEAFCDTFLSVALDAVPVDTGYLYSTIDAWNDGLFCEAIAEAEYAEYVEYGTWCMIAQPYFEPAVEAGVQAFIEEAQGAVDYAAEVLEDMCEAVLESLMESFGGGPGGNFMGDLMGIAAFALFGFLFFPLMVYAYGVMDSVFTAFVWDDKGSGGAGGYGGGGGVQIEII